MNDSCGSEQIGAALTIDSSYNALTGRYAVAADPSPLATLVAAVTKGVVDVIVGAATKPVGRILGLIAVGSDNDTVEETAYVVRGVTYGTTKSLRLEKLYVATHTLSGTVSTTSGVTGAKDCDACVVTSTNLLEGRVGIGPSAPSIVPSGIEVPDLGPGALGLVRIFKSSAVTTVYPTSTAWE